MKNKNIIGEIVERLFALCDERGMTVPELLAKSNVSANILNIWINDNFYPSVETLSKLCATLNVTVEEFFSACGRKLSPTQERILSEWKTLSAVERNALFGYISAMKECSLSK
ncbi:MAG: helix-turn-helix transcriptional regulator [Clostridia bacterium]|jgi:transcriptional regulator with XRE-family HTH domain|nr:helix-turn-helix transcriptional regulator [Clostridia bacterium]